jgi:hypothetical protein
MPYILSKFTVQDLKVNNTQLILIFWLVDDVSF